MNEKQIVGEQLPDTQRCSVTVPAPCSLFLQEALSSTLGLCWAGPTAQEHSSSLVSQLVFTHPQVSAIRDQTAFQEAFPDSPGIPSVHCPQAPVTLRDGPFQSVS